MSQDGDETSGDGASGGGTSGDGASGGGTSGDDTSQSERPSDTMRGRVPGSRLKLWLLLGADRWLVAGGLLAGFFLALLAAGLLRSASVHAVLQSGDPLETLFQAYVTALITGVTLVVTINQVVLSQELGAVGDQRERMEGALGFREDVESELGSSVSPPEPAAFLRALVDVTRARAADLADAVEGRDDDVAERVTAFVDGLVANADAVTDRLEDAQFGTFDVLFASLDFNYSWKVYQARRLRDEYDEALGQSAREALDDVQQTLRLFGPAREHFKTLYFQWELVNLSRTMLYASVPALAATSAVVLYVDPAAVTGSALGISALLWFVAAAATVAVTPFVVLVAYVLRIATVAKRTLAIGPFVLRETERTDDIDWEE